MSDAAPWDELPGRIRARGLRWTPQRRVLVDVLSKSDGHVTGAELIDRCRDVDPSTTPSTVYRTLDVLEELGIVQHAHGADGRERGDERWIEVEQSGPQVTSEGGVVARGRRCNGLQ